MKNDMSVFTLCCRKRWYLLHPLKFIKEIYKGCRNFIHRGRFGFGYCDVYCMDQYLIRVIPMMLRYLAKHSCCYPSDELFDTPEKYEEWLIQLAEKFELCNEDGWDNLNEYAEAYHNFLYKYYSNSDHDLTVEEKILQNKYFNRAEQIHTQMQETIKEAYAELAEHHDVLWD